jgi:hypothetical protein
MKAIQTLYRSFLFRSRLEARYAIFLDACHEKWDYEVEGFDLDNGDRYLPDFWLPRLKCFLEIKAAYPNKREIRVCRKLQFHTGEDVAVCYGLPMENEAIYFGRSEENGGMLTELWQQWNERDGRLVFAEETDICSPMICEAVKRAKQARFEHRPELYGSTLLRNLVNYEDLPF